MRQPTGTDGKGEAIDTVVQIWSEAPNQAFIASGFFLSTRDTNTWVLTNRHVFYDMQTTTETAEKYSIRWRGVAQPIDRLEYSSDPKDPDIALAMVVGQFRGSPKPVGLATSLASANLEARICGYTSGDPGVTISDTYAAVRSEDFIRGTYVLSEAGEKGWSGAPVLINDYGKAVAIVCRRNDAKLAIGITSKVVADWIRARMPDLLPAERSDVREENAPEADLEAILVRFEERHRSMVRRVLKKGSLPICAVLSASPNPSSADTAGVRRYHLGHLCFANLLRDIMALRPNGTALFLCPSSKYYRPPLAKFNERIWHVGASWMHVFEYEPQTYVLYPLVDNQKIDDGNCSRLLAWLGDRERAFVRPSRKLSDFLKEWKDGADPTTSVLGECLQLLDLRESEVKPEQAMSLAYILHKRPGWYEPGWFIKVAKSFVIGPNSIQSRLLGTDDFLLVEAAKNRAAWESLAFCASHFELGEFPQRAYFSNLPNATDGRAMSSSEPEGAIFLDSSVKQVKKRNRDGLLRVLKQFRKLEEPIDISEELVALLSEGQRRFGYPGSAMTCGGCPKFRQQTASN